MKIDTLAGARCVRLPAQLTLANAAAVRKSLTACAGERAVRIVLDLSRVQLADSSGLAAILACVRVASASAGQVVLMAPNSRVRALIELTRLDDVVAIVDDEGTALESLGAAVATGEI